MRGVPILPHPAAKTRSSDARTCFVVVAVRVFMWILMGPMVGSVWASESPCTVEARIDGAIGPATLDFIRRAESRVQTHQCGSLLLLINTPGGNLQTTRLIVENILASPTPILCLVHPSGGHAGSAGAIILQACHVSGAVEATNIGAATPVSSGGENIPEDLRKKLINDTRSWVEGLARLRGRSEKFARDIVEDAKALSAKEAQQLKAIDVVVKDKEEFLKFAAAQKVRLAKSENVPVSVGPLKTFEQDLRYKIMDLLTHPQVAYLMFMGSLALLYFELTHPGLIAPGVIGGLGLIISLVSMHMLEVTWGAVLLILLGIGLLIGEAFTPGFGILGVGGVVSFFIGSLFLFDPEQSGVVLPLSTILPTVLLMGALIVGVAYMALTVRRKRKGGVLDQVVGLEGRVSQVEKATPTEGYAEVNGEIWKVTCDSPMRVGDHLKIKSHQGLSLRVTLKADEKRSEP